MAFVDINAAFDTILTSWTDTDTSLTDITACMTDENLGTACGSEIRANSRNLRIQVDVDPALLVSMTIRLEISAVMTAGDYAMLAYNAASDVTVTDKVVLNIAAPGTFNFVATAGFISQLFDQGGGSFAIRITGDLNNLARISKSEADVETGLATVTVAGVTKDKLGATLGSVKVGIFRVTTEGPPEEYVFVGSTTSDGAGAYTLDVEGVVSDKFMVYGQKDGAPNVFDATDNTVVGV